VFAALGGENASFLSSAELEAQARATSSDEVSRVRNSRVMQLKAPYTIDMDGRIGGGRLPTGPIFIKDDKGNLVATMRPTQPRFTEDALKKQFRDVDEAFDFQPYGAPISTWIVNDVAQPGREEEMFRFDFFRVSEGWVHAQATPRDMSDNPRATVPNSGTGLPGISGLMYAPLAGLNRRASIGFRMAGLDGVASADFLTDPARWDQNEFEIALRTALEDGLTAGKQTGMKFKVMQRNNGVSIRVNYDGKGTVPTATEVATGFMCFMASRSR
jgi:hypothetical protein